jgi:hypothetical protein
MTGNIKVHEIDKRIFDRSAISKKEIKKIKSLQSDWDSNTTEKEIDIRLYLLYYYPTVNPIPAK